MARQRKRLGRYEQRKKALELIKKGMTNQEIRTIMVIGNDKLTVLRKEFKELEEQAFKATQLEAELKTKEEEAKANLVARYDEIEGKVESLPKKVEILDKQTSFLVEQANTFEENLNKLQEETVVVARKELATRKKLIEYVSDAVDEKVLNKDAIAVALYKG